MGVQLSPPQKQIPSLGVPSMQLLLTPPNPTQHLAQHSLLGPPNQPVPSLGVASHQWGKMLGRLSAGYAQSVAPLPRGRLCPGERSWWRGHRCPPEK